MAIDKTNKFSTGSFIAGGVVAAVATVIYFTLSLSCPPPAGVAQKSGDTAAITIQWEPKAGAKYYAVLARDSVDLDSVYSSVVVEDTVAILPGLQPNHGYAIDVFSICESGGKFSISKTPETIGARTGWIVIEDLALFGGDCQFGDCDSIVTQVDSCFTWGAGTEYYCIEVFENGSPNATPLVRTYLEKLMTGDTLIIHAFSSTPCSGAKNAIATATKQNCQPAIPFTFCGSFTEPGAGAPTTYQLATSLTGCCINLSQSKYDIVVRKCTVSSNQ